jgi:hypothetical protein
MVAIVVPASTAATPTATTVLAGAVAAPEVSVTFAPVTDAVELDEVKDNTVPLAFPSITDEFVEAVMP